METKEKKLTKIRDIIYLNGCSGEGTLKAMTNIRFLLSQSRKEVLELETLQEYLDLNTDKMFGTVDYEAFGMRVVELMKGKKG